MSKLKALVVLAAAMVGLGGAAVPAHAQFNLYDVAWVTNKTPVKSTIYYKWGNGSWRKLVINPNGGRAYFSYAFDGTTQSSPDLYIRFDVEYDAGLKVVEFKLSRGGSPDKDSPRFGHHFEVRPVPGSSDIRSVYSVTQGARAWLIDANSSFPPVSP